MKKSADQTLAYLPTTDKFALAETLVALANADGGLVVLGINPDGSRASEIWEEEATDDLLLALELCHPPVQTHWQLLETRQGNLVSLRVPRSPDLHALADGRVLVRHGAENRPISGLALIQLANTRTVGAFEGDDVAGATIADLETDIIDAYLEKRSQRGSAYVGSRKQLLFEIGAVTAEGKPTVMGMLLFGRRPQAFLPQSGVVFVKFASTEPRGGDGQAGYSRRVEIIGALPRVVEQAWNTVMQEMQNGARINGLEREEMVEYPSFAVREAIVNAICHRDYRIQGRKVEIRMYRNRLEVISPGGLAGHMTLDNLVEEHYSRNPRLVNGLFQWGYIEELGLGIDQMIEDMAKAGHPAPQFSTGDVFTVKSFNKQVAEESGVSKPNLNERQLDALKFVRERGSITNREYQRICEGISAETLRRDLADLVKRSHLLKIGSKKGTYYILK
ncbi:MAG TPA: hypothetical protein ENJ56_01445 [Anaerolineae bacterium]|nr:hypothetical protein [Anaerolineae bacterium]